MSGGHANGSVLINAFPLKEFINTRKIGASTAIATTIHRYLIAGEDELRLVYLTN